MSQQAPFAQSKNKPQDYLRAKALRKAMPLAEGMLWKALRRAATGTNLRFRRQHPIHPYFVDFICLAEKIVIEIDGFSHDLRQVEDEKRDAFLQGQGFKVLRFTNEDVLENVDRVVETIFLVCLESNHGQGKGPLP